MDPTDTATVTVALATAGADLAWPFSWMVDVYRDDKLQALSGFLLTLFVSGLRVLGAERLLDKKHLKWLAVGLSVLVSIGLGFLIEVSWTRQVTAATAVAAYAIAAWEVVIDPLRHRMNKKKNAMPALAIERRR